MSVFRRAITLSVISTTLCCTVAANADWSYSIDAPDSPKTIKRRELKNPTVAQIQKAISPRTRVDIIGTVDVANGDRLMIEDDDVRLDFSKADQVKWSGDDVWNGFIEVAAERVEVRGLNMKVESDSGRCRGMVVHDGSSDVMIVDCDFRNVADGLIADGNWQRLALENTRFLSCNDWQSGSMDGGYGMFLEDDDDAADHLWLHNVTVSLADGSGQHGLRIAKVQNIRLEQSTIGGNDKRSMWAYGVERMSIHRTVFDVGSVLFNLKSDEHQTDKPTQHIRMWDCTINHQTDLEPLGIFCGKSTSDFFIKNCDINSDSADNAIALQWREWSGPHSHDIRWDADSMQFNGKKMHGNREVLFGEDWSKAELKDLKLGAVKSF